MSMHTAEAPSRRGHAERPTTGRRTITIRGQVAPPQRSTTAAAARRRPPRRARERIVAGSPDRAALWAVLMGVFLILVAVMTATGA